MRNRIIVEESRGNIFADIGLPDPEERLAKAELAVRINKAIRSRQLTRTRAARILDLAGPRVRRLLRGQLSGFSTAELLRFLNLLGNAQAASKSI